jgi:hypothetical protein
MAGERFEVRVSAGANPTTQRLAGPLLFCHLSIKDLDTLIKLTVVLTRHRHVDGQDVGAACCHLAILPGPPALDLHGSTLPSLLQLLSRLEVFTNHNGLTTFEHLLPLVQTSRDTLIRLHVQLGRGPTYGISVALIGQLRKLRYLSVHTPVHDDSASPSIDEISTLNLPLLEDLHWTAGWANPPWISLLARSFFPRLKTVMIVARFHKKHASGLSQFFRRHSKLKVLTFNTLAPDTLPSLLQLPISAQVLQFGITVPPAETVFAHCPASVSTVSIPVPETGNSGEVITFLQRAHTLSLPKGSERSVFTARSAGQRMRDRLLTNRAHTSMQM